MLRLPIVAPDEAVSKAIKIPPVKRASRSPALTAPGHSPPKAKKSASSKEAEVPFAAPEEDFVATIRTSPTTATTNNQYTETTTRRLKRASRSPGLAALEHSLPESKKSNTTEENEEAIGNSIFLFMISPQQLTGAKY